MNWKLEVREDTFGIIANCKTDEECWSYTGSQAGTEIIGCIANTKEQCILSIEGYLINSIITTENLLKLKKEKLKRFRKKVSK